MRGQDERTQTKYPAVNNAIGSPQDIAEQAMNEPEARQETDEERLKKLKDDCPNCWGWEQHVISAESELTRLRSDLARVEAERNTALESRKDWMQRFSNEKRLRERLDERIVAAEATVQQLRDALPKWVSVEERLPDEEVEVDIWSPDDGGRLTGMKLVVLAEDNKFFYPIESGPCCVRDATHWMYPPAPPSGKEPGK